MLKEAPYRLLFSARKTHVDDTVLVRILAAAVRNEGTNANIVEKLEMNTTAGEVVESLEKL